MSYCLNPKCPKPDDPDNQDKSVCRQCGSELLLQGRYRITAPLGGGGFGKTFEVDDAKDNSRRVLKVLLKSHPKAVSLFKQEADVLCRLNHPGIPRVDKDGYFTFSPANSKDIYHCLIMEKIEGANLQDWMKSRGKPITQEQALDWLQQLVDILEKVHSLQYFHRDIKPQNIMCKPNGQLVLIDFGTAREVSKTYMVKVDQGQNITGIVSPGYTPQEQTQGKAVPQSDFFALGRTFVFLLTGKPPTAFPENPRSGKLLWRKAAPQIGGPFADIIDYLMAPFPGNRPQSPQMIQQCLKDLDLTVDAGPSTTDIPTTPSLKAPEGMKTSQAQGSGTEVLGKKLPFLQPKQIKLLKKVLLIGGSISCLFWGVSQIYGAVRYGVFPTNPIWLIQGWSSAQFLQETVKDSSPIQASLLSIYEDKRYLISANPNETQIWNVKTARKVTSLKGSEGVRAMALTSGNKVLITGGDDKRLRLWNLESNIRMLTLGIVNGHKGAVNSVLTTPNGKYIVSGGADKAIAVWFLPRINANPTPLFWLRGSEGLINALAINRGSNILVSGGTDAILRWWDLDRRRAIRAVKKHEGAVNSLAISGNFLVSSGTDNTIRLWDIQTGKILDSQNSRSVGVLTFHPDGKSLISGGEAIEIWTIKKDKLELTQTLIGHTQSVTGLSVSPDGKTLYSTSLDQTIKFWKLR